MTTKQQEQIKYWERRANQRFAESELYTEEQLNRIFRLYNEALRELQKEIEKLYDKYGDETGLDRQAMEQIMNAADLKKFINEVGRKTGKDISGLIQSNYKSRVNRLQALQASIQARVEQMTEKAESIASDTLKNVTEQSYLRTMYDIGRKENFNTSSFAALNDQTIDRMLQTKWVGKDNYSKRIWKNEQAMVDKLGEIITKGAMTGMSQQRMRMEFRQIFDAKKYEIERLLRTEMAYFHNEAEQQTYKDLGIERYLFIATLDNRTSDICASLDGKNFATQDGKAGVNQPPMHPNCRSTTAPYYNDLDLSKMKRRTRDEKGQGTLTNYKTYREWEKEARQNMVKAKPVMNHFKETYPDHAQNIEGILKDAPQDIIKLWNAFEHTFQNENKDYKGKQAHYNPGTQKVLLNIKEEAKGSVVTTPYETVFHEYSHLIDHEISRALGYDVKIPFSSIYGGLDKEGKIIIVKQGKGILGQTAKKEVATIRKNIEQMEFEQKGADKVWLWCKKVQSSKGYELKEKARLSDVLEGAGIGPRMPLGAGHGKAYWKNPGLLETEIFAGLTGGEIANPKSIEFFKMYLPETYNEFIKLVELLAKGNLKL